MKIEKLTNNKIRIILKQEDLKNNKITAKSILSSNQYSQKLLLDILNFAQKEVDFDTNGYKLLIETFSTSEDNIVFTITKFKNEKNSIKLTRKISSKIQNFYIYQFNNFNDFCNFCSTIKTNTLSTCSQVKYSTLYYYKNKFYLTLSKFDTKSKNTFNFLSLINEFAYYTTNNINFENILKEHGKIIIKKDAILTAKKYFTKS